MSIHKRILSIVLMFALLVTLVPFESASVEAATVNFTAVKLDADGGMFQNEKTIQTSVYYSGSSEWSVSGTKYYLSNFEAPTREDYVFDGWFNIATKEVVESPYTKKNSYETYRAIWTSVNVNSKSTSMIVNTNGGSFEDGYIKKSWAYDDDYRLWTIKNGEYVLREDVAPPYKVGYTFVGWTCDDGATSSLYPYTVRDTLTEWKAIWVPVEGGTMITLDVGSDAYFVDQYGRPVTDTDKENITYLRILYEAGKNNWYKNGNSYYFDGLWDDPVRDGYTFMGWIMLDQETREPMTYTSVLINPGTTTDCCTEYVAVWRNDSNLETEYANGVTTESIKLVLDPNGGKFQTYDNLGRLTDFTTEPVEIVFNINDERWNIVNGYYHYTLPENYLVKNDSWGNAVTLSHWELDDKTVTSVDPFVGLDAKTWTFTAKWLSADGLIIGDGESDSGKIHIDLDGGQLVPVNREYNPNGKINESDATILYNPGVADIYWTKTSDGKYTYNLEEAYEIKPSSEEYEFQGWKLVESNGEKVSNTTVYGAPFFTSTYKEQSFKAVWEESKESKEARETASYSVILDYGGGSYNSKSSYTFKGDSLVVFGSNRGVPFSDSNYALGSKISLPGYTFDGWLCKEISTTKITGTGTSQSAYPYATTKVKTPTWVAQWKKDNNSPTIKTSSKVMGTSTTSPTYFKSGATPSIVIARGGTTNVLKKITFTIGGTNYDVPCDGQTSITLTLENKAIKYGSKSVSTKQMQNTSAAIKIVATDGNSNSSTAYFRWDTVAPKITYRSGSSVIDLSTLASKTFDSGITVYAADATSAGNVGLDSFVIKNTTDNVEVANLNATKASAGKALKQDASGAKSYKLTAKDLAGNTTSFTVKLKKAESASIKMYKHSDTNKASINGKEISLNVGKTLDLDATASGLGTVTILWKSSNAGIASVTTGGKVTGVKAGSVTITAYVGSTKATITVKVLATNVTGVKLNKTTLSIAGTKSASLTATVSPSGATDKTVTWRSNKTSVATVDKNGKVTGVKAGTATITVKTKDQGKTATCKVTVTDVKVKTITLSATSATVKAGATKNLSVKSVSPTNAVNQSVTWTTSDKSIATVSSKGVVTAKKVGTVTITATAADGSKKTATCKIKVSGAVTPVTSVTLNKTTASLKVGKTVTLKATCKPTNASDSSVTWSTSDKTIATVSDKGVVTAKKKGKVTITATAADGSKKKATCKTCKVTVE